VLIFVIGALVSLEYLYNQGYWLLMPFGFLLMAVLSYRVSIEAAVTFGGAMNAAIDLHRFDMLKGLHLPLPANLADEKSGNAAISNFLLQGIPHNLPYVHPQVESDGKASSNVRGLSWRSYRRKGRGAMWKSEEEPARSPATLSTSSSSQNGLSTTM